MRISDMRRRRKQARIGLHEAHLRLEKGSDAAPCSSHTPSALRSRTRPLLRVDVYSNIPGSSCYCLVMGNPAGVRRDFDQLERRRLAAVELLRRGVRQAEAAWQVGAHRQSVSRWAQPLEEGGKRALRKAGRAGRKPRLSADDLRRIEKGLKRGPQALGFETALWTSWRVAYLIERECEIKHHAS